MGEKLTFRVNTWATKHSKLSATAAEELIDRKDAFLAVRIAQHGVVPPFDGDGRQLLAGQPERLPRAEVEEDALVGGAGEGAGARGGRGRPALRVLPGTAAAIGGFRSEEHTSELQSHSFTS